jgi:hypothetical protein
MTENCNFFGGQEVTAANIISGPPDAENQVYDAGDAPFSAGAEVWDSGHAFRSLVDGNNAALTDANSWEDLGEIDRGALLWVSASYAKDVFVVRNGRIWQSAKDSNTDTPGDAATSSSWTDTGPTTRLKPFVLNTNAPAALKGGATWVFESPKSMNVMLLILPVGSAAYVTVKNSNDDVIYDETKFRLIKDSGGGPYNHDFGPLNPAGRVICHGLPPGTGNKITLRITGSPTQNVGVTQVATGFAQSFGTTVTGSGAGVVGLQEPIEDPWGNITFPNRPVRRTARFRVSVGNKRNDQILSLAAKHLNRPAGMYMTDGVEFGLCVYGFVREVDLPMDNAILTDALIEIKGFAET